jgi:3-phosphoshikimate 1-carboxyvinyltransferase
MDKVIRQAQAIQGKIRVPGDKSISHRALLLGACARGRTVIENLSPCVDVASTVQCLKNLGVPIKVENDETVVCGGGLYGLRPPEGPLDAGNSGTTLRLLAGILAGQKFPSTLVGDESLQRRPMRRIIKPLRLMGAGITARDDNFAPLRIHGGKLEGISYKMEVRSAQVKSCILLAGLHAGGETVVIEPAPCRDHTERMLRYLGAEIELQGLKIRIRKSELRASKIRVPGDISSAAFLIAAASALPGSELLIRDVGINPTRMGFIEALVKMGAKISILNKREVNNEPLADLKINGSTLKGIKIGGSMIPRMIDELPLVAVIATQAEDRTTIREAAELRVKETDRIRAVVSNLKEMGASIEEFPDGMAIQGPTKLRGALIDGYNDHRIVMTFAVAGLLAQGETTICGSEWADVSFPGFFDVLKEVRVA